MLAIKKAIISQFGLLLQSSSKINLVAPIMVGGALLISVLTYLQVQSLVNHSVDTLAVSSQADAVAKIKKIPIPAPQYEEIATVLTKMNPEVLITPGAAKNSLIIAVSKPELEPEWIYVLSTLQSHRPGVIWEASRICMKQCTGGAAALAEINAFTQAVSL